MKTPLSNETLKIILDSLYGQKIAIKTFMGADNIHVPEIDKAINEIKRYKGE